MDNGLASFQRRMATMPVAVRERAAADLIKAADMVADAQRALVHYDSGDLEASIHVTGPGQSTPPYSQPGGSMIVPENAAAVTAGNSEVRYAHLEEHGTKRTTAHPFFWPGFRLSRAGAVRIIKAGARAAIRGSK